jgi:hypothetical protein
MDHLTLSLHSLEKRKSVCTSPPPISPLHSSS